MKESLLISAAGKTLAFGLEWQPLIESLGIREARRRASRYRATHFVLAPDSAGAVGLANIPRNKAQVVNNNQRVFSAAQNVAALFQSGTWGVCLSLNPQCWWMVAVHEGVVVMRTDILASNAESFDAVVSELRRAYPRMTYLQSGRDCQVPDLIRLAQASGPASLLQGRRRGVAGVPGKLHFFAGLSVVGCVVFAVAAWPETDVRQDTLALTKQDYDARWREAQQAALNKVVVHGVTGTQRLLDALYRIVVSPAGWQLRQVECVPREQTWHCVAQFFRQHPATDNQALESVLPASWAIEAHDLDRAQAKWTVPHIGLTLTQVQLPTETESRKTWLGILQRSSIAFDRIVWGQARPLMVTPPTDQQGRPVPRPEGLAFYQARGLQLSGPLRSYALLLADFNAVRWSRARLSINDKVTPGLRSSRFHLSLEGEFHERIE